MAGVQTYVRKGNPYTATFQIPGTNDADLIGGVYQVFVSVIHEWGDSIFAGNTLASSATAGQSSLVLVSGSAEGVRPAFTTGLNGYVIDGVRTDYFKITGIDTTNTILTLAGPLINNHSVGAKVVTERVATRDSSQNYEITLSINDLASAGVHKIHWRYVIGGQTFFYDQFINVYQPYILSSEFFDAHPELETDFDDLFLQMERRCRDVINTFCGQNFDYYPSKTMLYDGSGAPNLYLGMRMENLLKVVLRDDGSDMFGRVEGTPGTNFFLRLIDNPPTRPASVTNPAPGFGGIDLTPVWNKKSEYVILGDWGWPQVPTNITEAADLILQDMMNDDSAYQRHNVSELWMDRYRMKFGNNPEASTGNVDADILLMDYTIFVLSYI